MNLSHESKRVVRGLVLALVMSAAPVAATAPAASGGSTPPSACATGWGSLVKHRAPFTSKHITNVRTGRHRCFDRLVVDLGGAGIGRPGYQAKFVRRVTMDGSGARVPLRGGAELRLIVKAPAYDDDGNLTYQPARWRELVEVGGYRTFRQVAWAGTFEGQTTIGLGVRARLPMRTFVLADPDGGYRVIVDVAHHWY